MVTAVVLARMNSSRLPGKILRPMHGRPMLALILERLDHCPAVDHVVVATSDRESDDPLAAYCHSVDVSCFRGALDDVAHRTLAAARESGADFFFRANGDSPFLAVDLYASAVETQRRTGADVVTNVSPRTLPPGASVELIRTETLANCLPEFTPEDREHVTPFFYRHPERLRLVALEVSHLSVPTGLRLVVDDQADLERTEAVLGLMSAPHWTYGVQDVLDLHARVQIR
jgi:spore coat polysaccharide biosynthesis protein SpsF